VLEVEADSPAERAGVLVGDIVLAIQGQAVQDVRQIARLLRHAGSGQSYTLSLLRGGERLELPLHSDARAAA